MFNIFYADCIGREGNCLYPHKVLFDKLKEGVTSKLYEGHEQTGWESSQIK